MYREACHICEEPDMIKAYLYCCRRYLPEEDYLKMLSGNPVFLAMNSLVKEDVERAKKEVGLEVDKGKLAEWKKEYRV